MINELIATFYARLPEAEAFAARLRQETGTRFHDWIDHIQVPTPATNNTLRNKLLDVGFTLRSQPGAPNCFVHQGAMFPEIVLVDARTTAGAPEPMRVAIKVESVADFIAANKVPDTYPVEGEPLSRIRRALAFQTPRAGELGATELWVIERHGYRGYDTPRSDPAQSLAMLRHLENFRRRQRDFADDAEGYRHVMRLIDDAVRDLGVDWSCDIFFAAEREFWQRRNRAGQVQKARQDKLGLGWANHDHHTYRSSREHFKALIQLLEKLGFRSRERFYAGHEAGWGAQVIEQPVTHITIFADVDMSPEELQGDFAHEGLQAQDELGTVGLWCGLHGEAMLQAGMHHLECQFDHLALCDQLRSASINHMDPFTTFPFLRQAFTEGERWPVSTLRLTRLVQAGKISRAQAQLFRQGGAIGSHLENLERNDGYKGFNQQGVSHIIAKTDPRKQTSPAIPQEDLIGA
ncbi:MAG: hypothetical protein AB7G11_06755 [Phycisphaerales bacterium]